MLRNGVNSSFSAEKAGEREWDENRKFPPKKRDLASLPVEYVLVLRSIFQRNVDIQFL